MITNFNDGEFLRRRGGRRDDVYSSNEKFVTPTYFSKPRIGTGDYEITRNGGMRSDPRGRRVPGVSATVLSSVNTTTSKGVDLSDKTLSELFSVSIPDPSDVRWLEEFERMKADLIANGASPDEVKQVMKDAKPLGREQRSSLVRSNLGEAKMSNDNKFKELFEEVKEFRAETVQEKATIRDQLSLLFQKTDAISDMSDRQKQYLTTLLNSLNLEKTHLNAGLPRILDFEFYSAKDNKGEINLFLANSIDMVQPPLTIGKPVISTKGNPISVVSMELALKSGTVFLDLDEHKLITYSQLVKYINNIPNIDEIAPGFIQVNMEKAVANNKVPENILKKWGALDRDIEIAEDNETKAKDAYEAYPNKTNRKGKSLQKTVDKFSAQIALITNQMGELVDEYPNIVDEYEAYVISNSTTLLDEVE